MRYFINYQKTATKVLFQPKWFVTWLVLFFANMVVTSTATSEENRNDPDVQKGAAVLSGALFVIALVFQVKFIKEVKRQMKA